MTKVTLTFEIDQEKALFAKHATELLEQIVNKTSFHNRVLAGNYTGRNFIQDDGSLIQADNNLILRQILGGKEFGQIGNDIIELKVILKKLGRKTVGVNYPPDPLITTNTTFFNWWFKQKDSLSLAAHWLHEWLHVSGFRHKGKDPDQQDVNYLIGKYVVETGREPLEVFGKEFAFQQGQGYLDAYMEFYTTFNERQ